MTETFFTTFIGEWVRVITKFRTKESMETEEGIQESQGQIMLKGYLLDFDEEYYYLGDGPNEITQAIEKKFAPIIQIEEQPKKANLFEEILDNFEVPSDDKGN